MKGILEGYELCLSHSYNIQKAINDEADSLNQRKLPTKKINQQPK
uniref:Uncharacterized protein n=1 Tax=Anguilla anguilla TaxID=7936 RepID=A0A0E9XUU8_ANGAN